MQTRKRVLAAAAAMAISPLLGSWTKGAITTPADLNPGDPFYVMFLSSEPIAVTDPDPTSYNQMVSGEAATAGIDTYNSLPVTWQAFGSFDGGQSAIDRFNPNAPIYRVDGVRIADNAADLYDGSIQNPIDVQPDGTTPLSSAVWTGSFSDGTPAFSGNDSKAIGSAGGPDLVPGAEFGESEAIDGQWTAAATFFNTDPAPIYAFSSQIPEPATLGAAAGLMLLAAQRKVRRK